MGTFLADGGRLDPSRTAILGKLLLRAALAARTLPDPARAYFARAEHLGQLALEAVRDGSRANVFRDEEETVAPPEA